MSDAESVGDISDPPHSPSSPSPAEDSLPIPASPPSRNTLEREATKLKSKYRILRSALHEEQIGEIDRKLEAMEGNLQEALGEVEERKNEKLKGAYERKRIRVQAILADYESRIQALKDEKEALERALMTEEAHSTEFRMESGLQNQTEKKGSLQDDVSSMQKSIIKEEPKEEVNEKK